MSSFDSAAFSEDTIAAIATPPGEGGLAVIRISGPQAISIADQIFSGPVPSYTTHTVHYGQIHSAHGQHVDDVLLLVMRTPRSFTGEDVVEIHCHGGSLITRRVLETTLAAGARPAQPGEFTFRAFCNQKIDLAQAEAVQSLIHARNETALCAAAEQLKGSLSKKITSFQTQLTKLAAILEAWIDFPEEGLEFMPLAQFCAELNAICVQIEALIHTFHEGKILQEGLQLCLIGAPNVGKSSLMNALLRKDRAIVSATPGTTRDLIEEDLRFNGLHFRLVDTAGIRDTFEQIEQEGIRRTQEALKAADLILMVMDASRPLEERERDILAQVPLDKTIVVWNKIDLPQATPCSLTVPHTVSLSAKQEQGIEQLKETIQGIIWKKGAPNKEEVIITQLRHKESLSAALLCAQNVLHSIDHVSPEFLAMDLRRCLEHLGQVIGTDVTTDILNSIFSQFCIGK